MLIIGVTILAAFELKLILVVIGVISLPTFLLFVDGYLLIVFFILRSDCFQLSAAVTVAVHFLNQDVVIILRVCFLGYLVHKGDFLIVFGPELVFSDPHLGCVCQDGPVVTLDVGPAQD